MVKVEDPEPARLVGKKLVVNPLWVAPESVTVPLKPFWLVMKTVEVPEPL